MCLLPSEPILRESLQQISQQLGEYKSGLNQIYYADKQEPPIQFAHNECD